MNLLRESNVERTRPLKPGRNDPCPCGSGKKYKHCHLSLDEAPRPDEIVWRRVQRTTEGLIGRLMDTAMLHFGPAGIDEAWAEFNVWETEEPFDPRSPYLQVFMPWFLYNWLPDPEETDIPEHLHEITVAQAYVNSADRRLDPLARRYIEAGGEAQFSFHEVLACESGRGFRLRDAMTGSEHDVLERSGSTGARIGDLLYAKVVTVEGIAVLDGCTPVLIPPKHKLEIIELRAEISKSQLSGEALLHEYDIELRSLYLAIADEILYPKMPRVANTDGEPLELHTLAYDIDSAPAAFDALEDLAVGASEEELLEGAEFDSTGELVRCEIRWCKPGNPVHKTWDNTTLGTIRVEAKRLTAEVNSAARAERLARIIEERLGPRATKLPSMIQSVQSLAERERTPDENRAAATREAEHERLAALPEVRQALSEMMRQHYRAWVDQEIPALGGRTPREAVQDADGREAVAALVMQIERDAERMQPPVDPALLSELRERLGLVESHGGTSRK